MGCRQETLTPLDTYSRPIWNLHMFFLLRQIPFPNVSLYFWTMHFEHPSVLSRFCFLKMFVICPGVLYTFRSDLRCGQDRHVYKIIIRTFIHSFYTLPWWCIFLKHKIQWWPNWFLHRLNGNMFWVYRQCTLCLKIERYGCLVVALSDFAWRQSAVVAGENGPRIFFWRCAWFDIQSINQSANVNWILITFQVAIVALMSCL